MEKSQKNDLISLLTLLTSWRKIFIINFIIVAVISVIISLQLDLWYKSTAVIIPPADQQMGSGLASLMNNLPIAGLGIGMGGGSEMTYVAVLKSRSMAMELIQKYDLKNFYEKETIEETLIAFYSDFDVQLTEENMIAVTFEFKDSLKVAEIINYAVVRLAERVNNLRLERAQETKAFLEKRYLRNVSDIDSLADDLEAFQTKYGIIEFEEQTKALIGVVADIEAQLFIKRAELEAVERSFGVNSPQYQSIKFSLESLEKQLYSAKFDLDSKSKAPFATLFVPFNKIPQLGKTYFRLFTDLTIQYKLQEFLLPEYEQAKLQVLKDKPSLQVIDYASTPDRKSKPKRAVIVLAAVGISMLLTFLYALFIEHIKWLEVNNPEKYSEIKLIKSAWGFKSSNRK